MRLRWKKWLGKCFGHSNPVERRVALGRFDEALDLALEEQRKWPDDFGKLHQACRLLLHWGRSEECRALIERERHKFPHEDKLEWLLVKSWLVDGHVQRAFDHWNGVMASRETTPWHRMHLVEMLLEVSDVDGAEQVWQEIHAQLTPDNTARLSVRILKAQNRGDEALAFLKSVAVETKSLAGLYEAELRSRLGKGQVSSADLEVLEHNMQRAVQGEIEATLTHIATALRLGRKWVCERLLSRMDENDKRKELLVARAWLAMKSGDLDKARAIWQNEVFKHHFIPQLRKPSDGELLVLKDLPAIAPDRIQLFTVIRNERWRLPWFLSYYRKLGVDRFVFVDNGSTDGSDDYLLAQGSDVQVFRATVPYSRGQSGLVWLNALMASHGQQTWNLYVDVDEALVFPMMDELGLRGLVKYMDARGAEALSGQMVDTFSDRPVTLPEDTSDFDFVQEYPLFDANYERTPSGICPYFTTTGGVRNHFGWNENQTKVPLIRGGRGIQLLASSHVITPCNLSKLTCGLLHFKLSGEYAETFRHKAIANNLFLECRFRHAAYAKFFDQRGPGFTDFASDVTRRFTSWISLKQEGILNLPFDFNSFIEHHYRELGAGFASYQPNVSFSLAKNFVWYRLAKNGTRTMHAMFEALDGYTYLEGADSVEYWAQWRKMTQDPSVFSFTMVRNPFDRLVSGWKNKMWLNENKMGYFEQLGVDDEETRREVSEDFAAFVSRLPGSRLFMNEHFAPQSSLLENLPDSAFIGRFERYSEDLQVIASKMGIELRSDGIVRKNATKNRMHYSHYYTPELIEKVTSIYKEDLDRFGYTFEAN